MKNEFVFSCYFTMFYGLDTIPLAILFHDYILYEIYRNNGVLIRLRINLSKLTSFRYDRMEEERCNDEFDSRDTQEQQKEIYPIRVRDCFFRYDF